MSQSNKNKPNKGKPTNPGRQGLAKGVEIRCPRKGHVIGTLSQDLYSKEVVAAAKIKFNPGQERVPGEQAACKICGSVYFVQGKIYTQDGWKPNDPLLEPVSLKNMRK